MDDNQEVWCTCAANFEKVSKCDAGGRQAKGPKKIETIELYEYNKIYFLFLISYADVIVLNFFSINFGRRFNSINCKCRKFKKKIAVVSAHAFSEIQKSKLSLRRNYQCINNGKILN